MRNTLVWGYPKEFANIVDRLVDINAINLKVWIGTEKRCTYSRKNFMEKDLTFPFDSPVHCPEPLRQQVTADLYTYLEMQGRRHLYGYYYRHTMHDFLDYFQQQLNFFYHLLSSHQIEWVLIDKITHYGEDWILYGLARAMGIQTLLLCPSHFPNRFFYVYRQEDFGTFNDLTPSESFEGLDDLIQTGLPHYRKYLKNFKPYTYSLWDAVQDVLKNRQYMAFYKLKRYQRYQANLRQMVVERVDMDQPFVYFPFHLQPELTTFPLGDQYVDQVLALEALSEMLPTGWWIYAKENLHQTEYMRGEGFFARLKRIKNLKMVPLEIASSALIEKAQFIATVTGTAGWEAINAKKPALVFGRPWYLTLPGVVRYSPGLTVETVVSQNFSVPDVLESTQHLMTKTGKGTVGRQFIDQIDFDPDRNAEQVAQSLSWAMAQAPAMKTLQAAFV